MGLKNRMRNDGSVTMEETSEEVNWKEWEEVEGKSSLRWYRGVKSEFGTGRYITMHDKGHQSIRL